MAYKYKRWIPVGPVGELGLNGLLDIARGNGMKVICSSKPQTSIHYHIALAGKAESMQKTDHEWGELGSPPKHNRPQSGFPINTSIQRFEWAEENYS